jgi:hypothetical protein
MKRTDLVLAALLFIASLVLYIRTLAPSLLYGDSAEFQTIAFTLGIGHPTGYSVYVLFAKLFTFLPIGEVAYRVNLFSAVCAALTVGLIYFILRTLDARSVLAVGGALALAVSPLFWKYASMAEIYTPLTACLAFILLAAFQWRKTNQPRWLFVAGLTGGLSLGIHTSVALMGLPILWYLAFSKPERADWLQALHGVAVGLVLFTLSFLFLDLLDSPAGYYNSVVRPSLSIWGMTPADFDSSVERFRFLYFPPQFRDQLFGAGSEEVRARLAGFTGEGGVRLAFAALGLLSLWFLPYHAGLSHWREALLLLLAFLLLFGFALTYNVQDFYVYYIPVLLLLAVLMGLGLNAVVELSERTLKAVPFVSLGLSILILLLWVYPLADTVAAHWQESIPPGLEDWEGYIFQYPEVRKQEAEEIVSRLEDNAIVFTDWDQAYGLYYSAHVLQARRGLSFHETFPQEGVTRFADSAIEYIEANIGWRPIYFSERPSQLSDQYEITRAGSGLFKIEKK